MKKLLCLLLLAAMLCALCACGELPAQASSDEGQPAADPAAAEELAALLARVRQEMQLGTAGSSLRAVSLAAGLLDWAEGADITDEQLRQALEPWLGEDSDGASEFADQLAAVDAAAALLTTPGEEAEGLLADAGCETSGYPWSDRAAATLGRVMEAAGLRSGSPET